MAGAQEFLAVWDALQFGLLVHRAVADTSGYSVDLTLGFDARVRQALAELRQAVYAAGEDAHRAGRRGGARPLLMADVRRRQAVLTAYLEPDADAVREHFGTADRLYRGAVEVGDGQHVSDDFSQVLTELEMRLTMRCLGMLESDEHGVDRSARNLESVGLLHLVDELRADAVKSRLSRALHGDVVEPDEPADADGPGDREEARRWLAAGLAHLHNGDRPAAVGAARRAAAVLEQSHYGLFDQMERHFDRVVVAWVLGMISDEAGDRLRSLDTAVRLIEEVRGGWQLGSGRSDPTCAPLQTILTSCLRAACETADERAGWYALRMMEAMRRRHLAGMLRSVRFDPGRSDRIERSIVIALTDLVSLSEDQQLAGATDVHGVVRHRFVELDDGGVGASQETVTTEDLREELREAMRLTTKSLRSDVISDYFADAFLPDHVDVHAIATAVRGWHVLAFTTVDAETMARVWVDPGGRALVDLVDVTGCQARAEEMDWYGSGLAAYRIEQRLGRRLQFEDEDVRERLSSTLLPDTLRRTIGGSPGRGLVVVPDDWLSAVAWPALTDFAGDELIRAVDVALVPSVSLLREPAEPAPSTSGLAACLDYLGTGWPELDVTAERDYFAATGERPAASLTELLDRLPDAHDDVGWAYLACHGEDPTRDGHVETGESVAAGLGVQLVERDESRVTFLELLSVPWPRLVGFAGCFTARLNWKVQTGLAPLSLAVAGLAAGADTVLGSTDQLNDRASHLFVGWDERGQCDEGALGRIRSGAHPVRALAAAQRAWLAGRPDAAAPLYWARTVAVTQQLPA